MGLEICIGGYARLLVRGITILLDIADISLLGLIGSEICITGYRKLLVSGNTHLIDTAKHS